MERIRRPRGGEASQKEVKTGKYKRKKRVRSCKLIRFIRLSASTSPMKALRWSLIKEKPGSSLIKLQEKNDIAVAAGKHVHPCPIMPHIKFLISNFVILQFTADILETSPFSYVVKGKSIFIPYFLPLTLLFKK